MADYNVAERFVSINGEGPKAGQLAVFLRFGGCNLDCSYCDTRWANDLDEIFTLYSKEELYEYVKESGVKNVTLTGGEPLIHPGILDLIRFFSKDCELELEIETNGSISIREVQRLEHPPSLTMDYKLPGSGMELSMLMENFELLQQKDTVKFVVGSPLDLQKAKEIIQIYDLTRICHVYLSPVFGEIDPKEMVDFMIENRLNDVNLQLQLHKFIWSPTERGV